MANDLFDCLVIGGGPAGLTAAIYLARFHLKVLVVDRGNGRAVSIPRTHNHAGFPQGISGRELVNRMAEQAQGFGAAIRQADVPTLRKADHGFSAAISGGTIDARTVLLATGVTNNRPDLASALHDAAVAQNLLRYCPVCDGYEVTDKRVGVIGSGHHGAQEALFLRSFTRDVSLIDPASAHNFDADDRATLLSAGIVLIDGPVIDYAIDGAQMVAITAKGALRFDAIYPALGSTAHGDLARDLGAKVSDTGCIAVDAHQRTNVPGLYAAGDVVLGLDQISHAMGEAGVAATAIRNDLNADRPLYR